MLPSTAPAAPTCPEPSARAPRAPDASASLHLAPPSLQGAIVSIVCRDARGVALDDVQRLSHLPATPFVGLSVFQGSEAGLVTADEQGVATWRPFGATAMLSGSQSQPLVCWSPQGLRATIVLFAAEATRPLFQLEPADLHDRFVPAAGALDASWQPLLTALQAANDDAGVLQALQTHLAPRWRALQAGPLLLTSMRQVGRHWFDRLALQAGQWARTQSPRQVERRVKALSGRSLRDWQSLLKAEGLFFSARDRHEAGLPLDWPELALDEGFSDQAHLVRAVKRLTGFSPTAFTQRYLEDESFWLYRLWV